MPRYEHDNWGDITNTIFAKGIITDVDSENDTADVTVAGYQDGTDIPLFYHCSDDAEERSNGAIEGASAAFFVDDEVITMCEADTGRPLRIVGFIDGIRDCGIYLSLIRGDGIELREFIVDEDDFSTFESWLYYVKVYDSENNLVGQSIAAYWDEEEPTLRLEGINEVTNRGIRVTWQPGSSVPWKTGRWFVEIVKLEDEEIVPVSQDEKDPDGYFIVYNFLYNDVESQYPYKYKTADQRKEEDLVKGGTLNDVIPYFASGWKNDPPIYRSGWNPLPSDESKIFVNEYTQKLCPLSHPDEDYDVASSDRWDEMGIKNGASINRLYLVKSSVCYRMSGAVPFVGWQYWWLAEDGDGYDCSAVQCTGSGSISGAFSAVLSPSSNGLEVVCGDFSHTGGLQDDYDERLPEETDEEWKNRVLTEIEEKLDMFSFREHSLTVTDTSPASCTGEYGRTYLFGAMLIEATLSFSFIDEDIICPDE